MCIQGIVSKQSVEVCTVKDHFFWQVATGIRCDAMKANNPAKVAAEHQADVVALPTFVSKEAADYQSEPATLTVCSILNMKANVVDLLDDAAVDHVYQLNHVYVPSPTVGKTVMYEDRLFTVYDCWDFSRKIQVAFREKATLSLAQLENADAGTYVDALNAHEIKHCLLYTSDAADE